MVKGKRWKKGQSSSSNPSTHKHREMAKNNRNFFNFGLPSQNSNSHLTSQALAQLNASNNEASLDMKSLISDSESIGTRDSFASHWSDCTNATFNRVHKYWRSNSAMHKEILAVLAAVTEVIKENSGEGTEVEYFAALMTGIEPVKDNEETAAAFLYLISLAIRKVPENVLKVKFDELLKVFMEILEKHGENANNYVLIKSCLICMCCLLKCQEKKAWQSSQAIDAYKKILSFVNNQKPKIRKFSQQAISLILNGCSSKTSNDVYIQISGLTSDYCLKLMMGQSTTTTSDDVPENKEADYLKSILHMLSLLKHIVRHFEGEHLKMICENLLRLITLKDLLVNESCFQVFYQLFNSKSNQLTANFNAKLINALYDYQPSEQSGPQMIVWLAVMDSAIRSLNRLNNQLCLSHLPHLVQRFMQAFCSSHAKVHFAAAKCLNATLEQCIRANIDQLVEDLNSNSEMSKSILYKIFSHLEAGLSYQYHNAWPHIIKIIGCAFACFGHPSTFVVVAKCLHSLANLRESEQFDYIREADSAIARAIRTYGPKLVIDCVQLAITGDETSYEYPRSWMLPLLKENIKRTELAYFVKELMPLAKKLRAKSEFFSSQNQPIQAKIFENLQNQFWSLLPGFCNFPTDFTESFRSLAKTLGETLEKCSDLRSHVLKALRTLILSNTDENKLVVSKYAKNYLPIMFNLYTTDLKQDDSTGQALLDTTKLFLTITDQELVNTYLLQSMKNYALYTQKHNEWLTTNNQSEQQLEKPSSSDTTSKRVVFDFKKTDREPAVKTQEVQPYMFAKLRFLDLIAVLAKYANRPNIDSVFQLAIEGIISKHADKTIQKKSYKILDSILESGQPALNESKNEAIFHYIVEEKFESIARSLVGSLNDCASAAKVPRVKCLNALMAYVTKAEQKPLIRQILPEVILSVREVNQKSRDSSLALLNTMLRLWQKLGAEANPPTNEADSLDEFIRLVMVSLAGSINMISCGCLALSSLSYEFKENLSGSIIKDLVEAPCHLIRKSEHKEVIVSGLNLLKVLCSIFQATTLGQYLDCICDAIHSLHEKRLSSTSPHPPPPQQQCAPATTSTAEACAATAPPVTKSQRIKQFVKLILKKLMKKFTCELITQKLFANESLGGGNVMDTAAGKPALTAAMRHGLENLIANLKKTIDKDRARKIEEQLDAKKQKNSALDVISLYTAAAGPDEDNSKSAVLNEIGDLLKESDSESEGEDAKSRKTNKSSKEEKRDKREKAKKSGMAWLQENDEDNPLDLLDPMAIKSVLTNRPKSKREQEKATAKSKNGGFKMSATGKLVIEDDEEESIDSSDDDIKSKASRKTSKSKSKAKNDDLEEMMDTLSITKKSSHSNKIKQQKRKMDDDSDEDIDETKSRFTYRSGGTGIHRKLTDASKKSIDYGSEYKSKKAAGDMKVKNKPDPYAYIPFNPEKLNKRKRAKFSGEFKGFVKTGKANKQQEKNRKNN